MPAPSTLTAVRHRRTLDDRELFARYRSHRELADRDEIVLRHLQIADRCARRYARRGEPLADLTQVARLALVRCVDRFDPDRGRSFPAYAITTIFGELRHHFRDNCWAVSVPRSAKELRSQVQRADDVLSQQLGRDPTVGEIATALDVDADVVATTIDSNQCFRTEPLDVGQDGGIDRARARFDAEDPCADAATDRVRAEASLRGLDDRLQQIVVWRFYEGCTQREIGDRLGLGQVQVSRLLSRAMDQLRGSARLSSTP